MFEGIDRGIRSWDRSWDGSWDASRDLLPPASPTLLPLQPLVSNGLNLVCHLSLMILGSWIIGTNFFEFYYVSQQWYQSDPWLDACLDLDHMCDMRHWFSCCFPIMWFFLCLMASWGFATRIEFSIDPSMLLSVCWLLWSWSTSNSLDLILILQ